MGRQIESVTSSGINYAPGDASDPGASFHPESTVKGVSIGSGADHRDQLLGGTPRDVTSPGINSGSTVDGTFANTVQSEISADIEFQAFLIAYASQLTGYHIINNPTNPSSISPTTPVSLGSPSLESPSTHSHTTPIIHPENRSYPCSWHPQGSHTQCDYVAPDRPEFLRHLGTTHQVSGVADSPVICRLMDSTKGSACEALIKRGNFPRHVDTHYPVRHHCHHCPAGTSFSRKDSWKKHVENKHT